MTYLRACNCKQMVGSRLGPRSPYTNVVCSGHFMMILQCPIGSKCFPSKPHSKQFLCLNYFSWIFQHARSNLAAMKYMVKKSPLFSQVTNIQLSNKEHFIQNYLAYIKCDLLGNSLISSVVLDWALPLNLRDALLSYTCTPSWLDSLLYSLPKL